MRLQQAKRATDFADAANVRVLIVGSGLTGSLTCFHLRQKFKSARIDVADMARGAGGRMSTTRYGANAIKANTGAQYLSCFSSEAANLLQTVCSVDRVDSPLRRSTHFLLQPDEAYSHFLPRGGTNMAVKDFLSAGSPNTCSFESRLQCITKLNEKKGFLKVPFYGCECAFLRL